MTRAHIEYKAHNLQWSRSRCWWWWPSVRVTSPLVVARVDRKTKSIPTRFIWADKSQYVVRARCESVYMRARARRGVYRVIISARCNMRCVCVCGLISIGTYTAQRFVCGAIEAYIRTLHRRVHTRPSSSCVIGRAARCFEASCAPNTAMRCYIALGRHDTIYTVYIRHHTRHARRWLRIIYHTKLRARAMYDVSNV